MVRMSSVFRVLLFPIGGSFASVYPRYNWIGISRHCPKEVTPNAQQEAFATRKEGKFEFDFSNLEKAKTTVSLIQGLDDLTSVTPDTAGAIPSTHGLGVDFGRFLYDDLKLHAKGKKIFLEIQTSPSPRAVATQEMVMEGIKKAAERDAKVAGKDVKLILELNKLGETSMIAETGVYDTYMEKIQKNLIAGFEQAPEKWSQVTGGVLAPAAPSAKAAGGGARGVEGDAVGVKANARDPDGFLETTEKASGKDDEPFLFEAIYPESFIELGWSDATKKYSVVESGDSVDSAVFEQDNVEEIPKNSMLQKTDQNQQETQQQKTSADAVSAGAGGAGAGDYTLSESSGKMVDTRSFPAPRQIHVLKTLYNMLPKVRKIFTPMLARDKTNVPTPKNCKELIYQSKELCRVSQLVFTARIVKNDQSAAFLKPLFEEMNEKKEEEDAASSAEAEAKLTAQLEEANLVTDAYFDIARIDESILNDKTLPLAEYFMENVGLLPDGDNGSSAQLKSGNEGTSKVDDHPNDFRALLNVDHDPFVRGLTELFSEQPQKGYHVAFFSTVRYVGKGAEGSGGDRVVKEGSDEGGVREVVGGYYYPRLEDLAAGRHSPEGAKMNDFGNVVTKEKWQEKVRSARKVLMGGPSKIDSEAVISRAGKKEAAGKEEGSCKDCS